MAESANGRVLKPFTNVEGFLNPLVAGFLNHAGVQKPFTKVRGRQKLWQNWNIRYLWLMIRKFTIRKFYNSSVIIDDQLKNEYIVVVSIKA